MKYILVLTAVIATLSVTGTFAQQPGASRLLCYYDSTASAREGIGKLTVPELDQALQFCTHLIYGYAGVDPTNFKVKSLHENLDLDNGRGQFRAITAFKRKYPQLKVLLGIGGDKDVNPEDATNKYINLLESSTGRIAFVNSAHSLVKTYGFDGIDLAWPFPKNKAKKIHSGIGSAWKSFKKLFTGDFIVDEKADEHKEEFTALVREMSAAFRPENFLLGLTVLPNVNSTWFYDVPALNSYVNFVNLFAFDFQTPERNPKQGDYPHPIYALNDRLPESNVDYQVSYWTGRNHNNNFPMSKLNVGVPTYGRSWVMTKDSGLTGHPPVTETEGVAPAGIQSGIPGLLSWAEICAKLPNKSNSHLKGADAPLRKVGDPTKRFGPYAYRTADDNGEHGVWVAYEDPDSVGNKAGYVRAKGLGGIALFDLSFDDFRGSCTGDIFPLLRAAKYRL